MYDNSCKPIVHLSRRGEEEKRRRGGEEERRRGGEEMSKENVRADFRAI